MTNEEFEKGYKYNLSILDKLDLSRFLISGKTIWDIRGEIEDAYDDNEFSPEITEMVENDIMQGFIFNYLSEDEFMDYLVEKYNIHIKEDVHIDYYIL